MSRASTVDFAALREGLKALPRTPSHHPGHQIDLENIVLVPNHRAALDPDRTLVVGNRGVGKSFWTDVLADADARRYVAKTFRELATTDVVIGFNASERVDPIAPTESAINQAFRTTNDADALWRAVVVRAALDLGVAGPKEMPRHSFAGEVVWVRDHGEQADRIATELDDRYARENKKLVIVFDALDKLGPDWTTKRVQTAALLKRALAARSYRSIRLKLFMRRDQYEDPHLFQFADGSKIANQRVDLQWSSSELYTLLFTWLAHEAVSEEAFRKLVAACRVALAPPSDGAHERLVNAIAGEFMGATAKQGRVYSWLPLHLADARGETSPRTFLTAWREAAHCTPAPQRRALDHRGIHEGVRSASEDRLKELDEDYRWIKLALQPLRDQQVPMDRMTLRQLWATKNTAKEILKQSQNYLPPVRLDTARQEGTSLEDSLIEDLHAIGIIEVRPNGRINIPDIFRLEAGIKRKGGVASPRRAQRD